MRGVQVHEGLVWVYAEAGPQAEQEASRTPKATLPKLTAGGHVLASSWFQRDLPYGADVLCENVIDPAHVPFSHHGVQGDRFKVAKMLMRPAETVSTDSGFVVHSYPPEHLPKDGRRAAYDISFQPPTLIRYQYQGGMELVTHAVPIDPGRSRVFYNLVVPEQFLKGLPGLLFRLRNSKWLLWLEHIVRNKVLDGDSVFLALQDEELRMRGPEAARNYFMPASLDSGVRAFREWTTRHAAPMPWAPGAWARPAPGSRTRREMLDRYEQHTRHCPSCLAAHRVLSVTQWVGAFASAVACAAAACLLATGQPVRALLAAALLAAASGAVGFAARRCVIRLEFQDYV